MIMNIKIAMAEGRGWPAIIIFFIISDDFSDLCPLAGGEGGEHFPPREVEILLM